MSVERLTAAGCPHELAPQIMALNVPWSLILALVEQFGPAVWTVIKTWLESRSASTT